MADKSKSIKNATDKELDELLSRLRKERELQYLIADLKRASSPSNMEFGKENVSTEEPIDSLYHFGVLGMKWGRRKSRSSRGGKMRRSLITIKKVTVQQKPHKDEDDVSDRNTLLGKHVNQMSTAELKRLNTRLEAEKRYSELTKKEISPGKKFVKDVLANSAKQAATNYVTKHMTGALESTLTKKVSP